MFVIVDNDTTFAPVLYRIDTPDQQRIARIALAAAGLESAPVFANAATERLTFRPFFATVDPDDEVTAVYTPSPDLLRAAGKV